MPMAPALDSGASMSCKYLHLHDGAVPPTSHQLNHPNHVHPCDCTPLTVCGLWVEIATEAVSRLKAITHVPNSAISLERCAISVSSCHMLCTSTAWQRAFTVSVGRSRQCALIEPANTHAPQKLKNLEQRDQPTRLYACF